MKAFHSQILVLAFIGLGFGVCNHQPASAQSEPLHRIEGRLVSNYRDLGSIRVRLTLRAGMRRVAEAITRQDGKFEFDNLIEGDYLIDIEESDQFEAAQIFLEVRTITDADGSTYRVPVHLRPKAKAKTEFLTGSLAADIDVGVPEKAQQHYVKACEAKDANDTKLALRELRSAIDVYKNYYSARLLMGRLLRSEMRFKDAMTVLEPLVKIAPKQADPLVELGMIDLALNERTRAADRLRAALAIDETNWTAHLYLGYALVDINDAAAEPHFWRALKLNEREAVEAHLALARLAHRYGYVREAIEQLEAYLAVVPNAPDAEKVRDLARKLREQLEKKP